MADFVLLDAVILIDYFRGHADAVRIVEPLLLKRVVRVHPVVLAEIIVGARDRKHLAEIEKLLRDVPIVPVKPSDFAVALDLLRAHHLSTRVGWADCLIAATALRADAALMTINDKHFRAMSGLRTIRPY